MPATILAIDDDRELLDTLKDILEEEGYIVEVLADPMETEKRIDECNPDLLIIDVFMPKRTGFNLIEEFNAKNLYHDLPKIFLTCLNDDIEKMTARARGIVSYITKPFEPQELIDAVKETLKKRKVD